MFFLQYKYFIFFSCCLTIFCNYYTRDYVASVEKNFEFDTKTTVTQYRTMISTFFLPNIVTPLLGSIVATKYGPSNTLILAYCISFIGSLVLVLGVYTLSVKLMIFGRLLMGLNHEVINSMCYSIVMPQFSTGWGYIYGVLDMIMFSGSICNLVVTPITYKSHGVRGVFLLSSATCFTGLIFAVVTHELYILGSVRATSDAANTAALSGKDSSVELVEDKEGLTDYENVAFISDQSECKEEQNFPTEVSSSATALTPPLTSVSCSVLSPFFQFTSLYYFYLLTGVCTYGSLVFTFLGSRYLQDLYGIPLLHADRLLLLPDGINVILAIPIGTWLERSSGMKYI